MQSVINADCADVILKLPNVRTIFMDPPDNIGLSYGTYKDSQPDVLYYPWLESLILKSMLRCETLWISYYWKHDVEIKHRVWDILKYRHPVWEAKTFIWRFTFGQHMKTDCGSGFRYILRLSKTSMNMGGEYEESWRQAHGDPRANPEGRLPDDVWDFPRVTGNSPERCAWHPTQHPRALLQRMVRMSGGPVVDCFAGTGSMLHACRELGVACVGIEMDGTYCQKMGFPILEPERWLKGDVF